MDSLGFFGHATTLIRLGASSAITDPLLGGNMGVLRRHGAPVDRARLRKIDVVLLSHLHRDHFDLRSLRSLPASVPAVVPRGAAALAAKGGRETVIELGPGETATVAGLEILATPATHDGHRDRWGDEVSPLGFVVSRNRKRVYFAGDTDLFDQMAELGPLDAALLPVWGWGPRLGPGHLDPARAAEALRLLRPRLAVPIHWGTLFPRGLARLLPERLSEPPLEFQRAAASIAPDTEVRALRPGESLELGRARRRRRAVA